MKRSMIVLLTGIACLGFAVTARAADSPKPEPVPELNWRTDYAEAMREAMDQRKMLFLFFHDIEQTAARRGFEEGVLRKAEVVDKLSRFVVATLPVDVTIPIKGEPTRLLRHAAFGEMLGRQGIAIVDFEHKDESYFGRVVSTFPFTPGKLYTPAATLIVLDLPPGTLTQRTMIFAVRRHPEAPRSTEGALSPLLVREASMQSDHQADILLQGHHAWESRFQRISAQLPGGMMAQEVVAESWPNENLVEACIDCVDSWRQSPGHWGAVRERHPLFGYDIKRGRNGIWYATGIFGRR